MPLTANEIAFFAAATMTDTPDGGGPRSAVQLQSTATGQVFPAVASADRSAGRVRLRKVYPSLLNADTAPLLGASAAINEVPADAAVTVSMMAGASALETRAQAAARLEDWHRGFIAVSGNYVSTANSANLLVHNGSSTAPGLFKVGDKVGLRVTGTLAQTDLFFRANVIGVGNTSSSTPGVWYREYLLDRPVPVTEGTTSGVAANAAIGLVSAVEEPRLYGAHAVSSSVSNGATDVPLASRFTQVIGYTGSGTYPTANNGLNPSVFAYRNGQVQTVKVGDACTLWHEAATSPATAVNGTPISTGRTNLEQLAIVGANGQEIVRFLAHGPTPSPAVATVDLAAGTVTPTNVTGWSQPVTVRHRISHRSIVTVLSSNTVTLANALTRDFPSGAVLSTHIPLGDVQARALAPFGQQAWTRVWSDTLIGNPAPLPYTGAIAVTNQGAETDRYAIVMTGANTFEAYSERLGLLGTGSTTALYAPLNAATGAPLFSLASAGWAAGRLVGSVLRFNVEGAAPPVWMLQTIAPSSPAGSTSTALRLFGSV
jgi:hypothetical protein